MLRQRFPGFIATQRSLKRPVDSPDLLEKLVKRFGGDRLAVSVDAKDGKVAVKGWTEITAVDALDFIESIEKAGGAGHHFH